MTELSVKPTKNLLDKGYIRFVDHMGSDLSIVRTARNSHDAAWRAGIEELSDHKLIHFLWKNLHTTPFESVTLTFEVKAPIFVFRQWHRHRTQSYNEMSARYTELPSEWYLPPVNMIGKQCAKNKQQRDTSQIQTVDEFEFTKKQIALYNAACTMSYAVYKALMLFGWPRELARMCLPFSMYSKMFCTMNLLNALKFITLRDDPHAQYEIQVYAQAMLEQITPIVPVAIEAYEKGRDRWRRFAEWEKTNAVG